VRASSVNGLEGENLDKIYKSINIIRVTIFNEYKISQINTSVGQEPSVNLEQQSELRVQVWNTWRTGLMEVFSVVFK